jgi:N-acetyltransferase 10
MPIGAAIFFPFLLQDIVPRFNERMVLSLASCPNCIMMDDELNVLPTSR